MRSGWLAWTAFDFRHLHHSRLIFVVCSPTLEACAASPTFFELVRVFQRTHVAFTRGLRVVFVLHSRKIS
jgi:hypothetical protein